MIQTEYIIVGQGFAGSFLAVELLKRNKKFVIIDSPQPSASSIAAGVYNPVVLKRFNLIWQASLQLNQLHTTLDELGQRYNKQFYNTNEVYRIFHDESEKIIWLKKSENPNLKPFLSTEIRQSFPHIHSPFGAAAVHKSGRVKVNELLHTIRNDLKNKVLLIEEQMNYARLKFQKHWQYKNIIAKHIIFAEGKGIQSNPYFNYLPIRLNKGECLQVRINEKFEDKIYKKKDFLFPLAQDIYYVGGTYDPNDTSEKPTEAAQNKLLHQLKEIYSDSIEVHQHSAAFRPTTPDRRPIVGVHPSQPQMYVLNGLGSRGTLLGASCAKALIAHIEDQMPLDEQVRVSRFRQ